MRTLHLFAGAGGGLLADLILGHEPIGAVERDPYCCEILRERAKDGWFKSLTVHEGDIREFDASEYAGRVDLIHAGFPCQPFSVAGKQLGADDPRDLWPATLSVIRVVRPAYVFLENVPGLVAWNDGERVADIIGSLAGMGYVGSHGVLGANDAGAAHLRKRWWCVAYADSDRLQRRADAIPGERATDLRRRSTDAGDAFSDSDSDRRDIRTREQRSRGRKQSEDGGVGLAQSLLGGVADGLADGMDAPGWWGQEPEGVPRVAQGVPDRVARLRALGNGQVPLQAAMAWRILSRGFAHA